MGVINTPNWIQISPVIAAVVTGIVFIGKIMSFVEIMKPLPKRVDKIARGLTRIEIRFDVLEKEFHKRIPIIEKNLTSIKTKVELLSKCKNFSA